MRLFLLAVVASCGMTQGPVDVIPHSTGLYCEPLSTVKQICYGDFGRKFLCIDNGGRWECTQLEGQVFVE